MKSMKKIAVSLLTAVALTGSAFGAFAADANSITSCKISIVSSDNTATEVTDTSDITINPNQMLKFEVELAETGDVTLFSATDSGTTYSNDTIQYVEQKPSKATIVFKPRATLSNGTYSVKVGGTDVAEAKTYTYTVKSPLTVAAVNKYAMVLPADLGTNYLKPEYATYTISGVESVEDFAVQEGSTVYTKDTDYSVSNKNSDGTFTLTIEKKFTDNDLGTKTLTITAGETIGTANLEVCPAVKYNTNVSDDNDGYVTKVVYAPAVYDASVNKYMGTLKPVESALSTKKAKVVSQGDYFMGYQLKGDTTNCYSLDKTQTLEYSNSAELDAKFDAAQSGFGTSDIITKAGAQAIKYKSSEGDSEKEAIRFIALIDYDENYRNAGFVVSDIHYNPTIEGGFAKSVKTDAYKSIYARKTSDSEDKLDVTKLKATIKNSNGTKLENNNIDAIIFSVLNVSETQKSRKIYATPYVVKSDGTRVYGETIGVSYNELSSASADE